MKPRLVTFAVLLAALTPAVAHAHDTDGDGIEDEWEIVYGLNPLDPSDGVLDPDGDGLDNLAEFLGLTNPHVFDGPTAPSAVAPINDVETSAAPTLVVQNATDPNGDALVYSWEVYTDQGLTSLVASAAGIPQVASGQTSWLVDVPLAENTPAWWRARASDPYVGGAWTVTAQFFVNEVNEAPTTPAPASPQDGELLPSLSPTFQLGSSTDPDGDAITYAMQVWSDAELTQLLSESPALTGSGGLVEWTLDAAMTEDAWGWLRARATDEHGLAGDWTPSVSFHVSGSDAAPTGLAWMDPLDDGVVGSRTPILTVGGATDAEGATVQYAFEAAADATWAGSWTSGMISAEEDGAARWDLALAGVELDENAVAWARARASDGAIWSPWESIAFFVNSADDPPGVPELVAPDNGADIGQERPVDLVATWVAEPDRDPLEYAFVVAADEALTDVRAAGTTAGGNTVTDGAGQVSWSLTEDLEPGTFWWSVQAVDDGGLQGGFATPRTLVVAEEEVPTPPPGGYSFGDRDKDDCACEASLAGPGGAWWLALAALVPGLRRRRRHSPRRSSRAAGAAGVTP